MVNIANSLVHFYYFAGCNNNKNKAGYNRLEADDFDSDGEFSRIGKIPLLISSKRLYDLLLP